VVGGLLLVLELDGHLIMALPRPIATLFPYTTLFRSHREPDQRPPPVRGESAAGGDVQGRAVRAERVRRRGAAAPGDAGRLVRARSEEHTSELQSRENLVCRLLLEKKQTIKVGRYAAQ